MPNTVSGPYTGSRHTPTAALAGRKAAAKQLLQMLGIGLTAGAGARAVGGVYDMFNPQKYPAQRSAMLPKVLTIPKEPQETEKLSQAGGVADWLAGLAAKHKLVPTPHTTSPLLNDWGIPAGVGAIGLGLYGGYQGTDKLLKKERQISSDADVEDAEDDYRKAMAEQYRAAMRSKAAGEAAGGDDDLGTHALAAAYTQHCDAVKACPEVDTAVEKQASPTLTEYFFPAADRMYIDAINTVSPGKGYDYLHGAKGAVNAGIAATGLGTALAAYKWTKGRNEQEIMRKALQLRQQRRRALSPPPLVAIPEGNDNAGK